MKDLINLSTLAMAKGKSTGLSPLAYLFEDSDAFEFEDARQYLFEN